MLHFFYTIIDMIFPPREEELLVRTFNDNIVDSIYQLRFIESKIIALSDFKDQRVRALIHEAKFHFNRQAFVYLGRLLTQYQKNCREEYLYIPIPLSQKRRRKRGFNQVEETLKHSDCTYNTKLLRRIRHTTPQTDLKESERRKNLKDCFAVNIDELRKLKPSITIVVVDDVTTTGSTLGEAAAALRAAALPNHLILLALAH